MAVNVGILVVVAHLLPQLVKRLPVSTETDVLRDRSGGKMFSPFLPSLGTVYLTTYTDKKSEAFVISTLWAYHYFDISYNEG